MKTLFTRTLVLLLALTWLVPKANAAGYEYTVTAASDWGQTFTNTQLTSYQNYFSAAVSNNYMYSVPAPTTTNMMKYAYTDPDYAPRIFRLLTAQEYFTFPTNAKYFPYPGYKGGSITSFSGYFYMGPAHAADTKGNLYFSHYSVDASAYGYEWAKPIGAITAFSVDDRPIADASNSYLGSTSYKYQSNATPTTIILDPTYDGAVTSSATNYRITYRSDVMSAYGDGLGGTGYLWFAPNNGGDDVTEIYDKIECIILSSGKITDKKIFNVPEVNTTRSRVVQYADNKLLYNNQATGKLYKGTINASLVEDGTSVTWTDLGLINQGTGATMFMLGGREILVYSPTFDTSATSFRIVDVTDVDNMQVIGAYSPFTTASGANQTRGHFINVSNVDDYNANIYIFVPKVGTEKYTITATATDPVQDLKVSVVAGADSDQPSRQDAVLTWEAPANVTPTEYQVWSRTRYTVPGESSETVTDWVSLGTTEETTYTHKNIVYRHISSQEYERHYDYYVVPMFSGALGAQSDVVTATPDFIPFRPIWDPSRDRYDGMQLGIDRYDGYCKVQLYWKYPEVNKEDLLDTYGEVYGIKPDYYSIERNGVEIATKLTANNYIDQTVSSDQTYTYRVISHYNSFPADTAWSLPMNTTITRRDWSKINYKLSEIYNYKIGSTAGDSIIVGGTDFSNFTTRGNYAQGVYHNGYWYIAQLQNSDITSGGIIKISAAAPWEDDKTENVLTVGKKIYTNTAQSNKGIACDEGGNLFIQSGTINNSKTTEGTIWYNCMSQGTILMNNGNGTYTPYIVDLYTSEIDLSEGGVYAGTGATIPGRTEYYSMSGNLTGGTASNPTTAYLYLAPHVSRSVFVVKLTYNGSNVTASLHAKYHDDQSISNYTGQIFKYGSENFAYPVNCEGRENEFIHQIRSVAHSVWKNSATSTSNMNNKANRVGTMYDSQSRVNTSGGCTFTWNDELFVVVPQSQHSKNTGNFYVGMAERKTTDITTKTADLTHIIPADMWAQDDAETSAYSSANGMWLHAEPGDKDINGDGVKNDYAYIYMYVPGTRIAKYMLVPSNLFPPAPVDLDIEPVYAEEYDATAHNPGGDIERFDATASWSEDPDYGNSNGGNSYYRVSGYTLELVDAQGNAIADKDENGNLMYPIIEFDVDADGNVTAAYKVTTEGGNTATKTPIDINSIIVTTVDNKKQYSYVYSDVKKDVEYTALVTVNYMGIESSNNGVKQTSPKTQWESTATYIPDAPSGYAHVEKTPNNWEDWDADYKGNPTTGDKDDDDAYFDNYRVCLDIDNPDFVEANGKKEPVTNYNIGIDSNKDGTVDQPVNEFYLYVGGSEGSDYTMPDGNVKKVDHDGYIKITDGQIPGDYNFDIETGGKPHVYWDMKDYTSAPDYDDKVNYTDENNPSTWNYVVTANYAAGNARISSSASDSMVPGLGGITTGVEVISTQSVLNVYPIPATISVTIKCSEAIEQVEIYSASGLLVKTLSGDGEQVMTVNVSDLASGYYFMRVNNLAPVKIIKN